MEDRIENVMAVLKANNGRFVGVTFTKKDGSTRRMNLIFSARKVAEHRFNFNPITKGLIPVWDVVKAGIRFINCNDSVEVRAAHVEYTF